MSEDLEPIEKVEPPCQIYYLQSSSGKVYRCYRTSEADKVIAELESDIVKLKSALKYLIIRGILDGPIKKAAEDVLKEVEDAH